jgi:hypothetical protein
LQCRGTYTRANGDDEPPSAQRCEAHSDPQCVGVVSS